ncbi:hypothetical protein [Terasakiella pusilla]|uniref:hypothetical protein n=1 Tax=Terasakiella pusilla TaxID=64973 RepID=UPI003AA92817
MFASQYLDYLPKNQDVKFHRYVQTLRSQKELTNLIDLLKVKRLLIGEIDPATSDLLVPKANKTEAIYNFVRAITQDKKVKDNLFEELLKTLVEQRLFATVFNGNNQMDTTLVLAKGPIGVEVTYISVSEETLLNSVRNIREI